MERIGFKRIALVSLVITCLALLASLCVYSGVSFGREPSPFVELFEPDMSDCPTFCWHGIRVGETTLNEAEALLRDDPAFTAVERFSENTLSWETTGKVRIGVLSSDISQPPDNRIDYFHIYLTE